MSTITGAIQDVATYRATNGSQQSRIGFAVEVLATNKANLEAANSRIIDVDVAEESTQMARYNILVQAGTAMLAAITLVNSASTVIGTKSFTTSKSSFAEVALSTAPVVLM